MEFENIKELIKLFDESSISKLKISRGDFSIDLEKGGAEVTYVAAPKPLVQALTATQVVDISAPVETSHTVSDLLS